MDFNNTTTKDDTMIFKPQKSSRAGLMPINTSQMGGHKSATNLDEDDDCYSEEDNILSKNASAMSPMPSRDFSLRIEQPTNRSLLLAVAAHTFGKSRVGANSIAQAKKGNTDDHDLRNTFGGFDQGTPDG